MPVFKANYAEYSLGKTPEENLQELFSAHNDLISRLNRTVNNLDEENLNIDLTNLKGSENDE